MKQEDNQKANNKNKEKEKQNFNHLLKVTGFILFELAKIVVFMAGVKGAEQYLYVDNEPSEISIGFSGVMFLLYELGYFDPIGIAIYNFIFSSIQNNEMNLHKHTKYYSTIIHFKDEILFDDLFNERSIYENMQQQKTNLEEQQIKYDVLLKIILEHILDQKASKENKDRGLFIK